MANDRYFAVPLLNSHRREEEIRLQVEPDKGVKVALGMEVAYAPPPVFPPPSQFVERLLQRLDKSKEPLGDKLRARVLAVAEDVEASDPYIIASGSCTHSVTGEIGRETAERLASDGKGGPAKLESVLVHPEKLALQMRFRDIRQLLFQVDPSIEPTKVKVKAFAGKVAIGEFSLYIAPAQPKPKP
jgi:hypothetical protein